MMQKIGENITEAETGIRPTACIELDFPTII
jgi:hypothetical protein